MAVNKNSFNFGPLFIALAAFLWTTDVFVRGNLEGSLTSVQITLVDHWLIMIVISPYLVRYIPKILELTKKEFFAILWIGIGGSALATIALTEGFFLGDFPFQYAAIVVLLQQLQPIIAIGLAHLLLKERLPPYFYILSLISIGGVIMIIWPFFLFEGTLIVLSQFSISTGLYSGLLGMTAAILWGSSTVMGRYILNHGNQKPEYKQMTAYRFFIAAIFLSIFALVYPNAQGYPSLSVFNAEVTLSILYLGLIVGLFSLILYYYGLKTTHASVSAISELAFPLSFFVIMPLLNIQPLAVIQYVGAGILIAASTALSYTYGKVPDFQTSDLQAKSA